MGEAIAAQTLQNLEDWQLPASQLCDYDGAGAMVGKGKDQSSSKNR